MPYDDLPVQSLPDYPDAVKLFHFLTQQGQHYWRRGTVCEIDDSTQVTLKHNIFWRGRNKDASVAHRFELQGSKLASQGVRSKVSNVYATLTEKGFKPAGYKNKEQLLKREVQSTEIQNTREFDMLEIAGHISVKPPAFIQVKDKPVRIMVMRKIAGKNLSRLMMTDHLMGYKSLGTEDRLKLTLSLLCALKWQAHEHGIIHRDIKPENIIVRREEKHEDLYFATLIDYGFAVLEEDLDGKSSGTEVYAAPELLSGQWQKQSCKADIYSMAKVIVSLWGGRERLMHGRYVQMDVGSIIDRLCQHTVPQQTEYEEVARLIQVAVREMLQKRPKKRLDVDQAINTFVKIQELLSAILSKKVVPDAPDSVSSTQSTHQASSSSSSQPPALIASRKRGEWHRGSRDAFFDRKAAEGKYPRSYSCDEVGGTLAVSLP